MMVSLLFMAATAQAPAPPGLAAFIRDMGLVRYDDALTDLNGDGRPEALVYAMATKDGGGQADLCGSGGCELYVLLLDASRYRVVSHITVSRPPVAVLADVSHGWHDLSVGVAGGGIVPGYQVRLRFDGKAYPSNPTVPPARRLTGRMRGKIVMAETSP